MACSCNKAKKSFEVLSADATKVLYTSTSEQTAKAVAKRYPGSEVREKPKTAATA